MGLAAPAGIMHFITEDDSQRRLYFEGGAREVWICDTDGLVTFYDEEGQISASRIAIGFPDRIE